MNLQEICRKIATVVIIYKTKLIKGKNNFQRFLFYLNRSAILAGRNQMVETNTKIQIQIQLSM